MTDTWTPDPDEVSYLRRFSLSERECVCAIACLDDVSPLWQVGEAAGFDVSSTDEEKRRKLLQIRVSRMTGRRKAPKPAIASLMEHLKRYRTDGPSPELPPVGDVFEVLRESFRLLRSGNDRQKEQMVRTLLPFFLKEPAEKPKKNVHGQVADIAARLGADRARAALELLAPGLATLLPEESESESNRRDGVASPKGVHVDDSASRGVRGDGHEARGEVERRDDYGVGRSERRIRERLADLERRA